MKSLWIRVRSSVYFVGAFLALCASLSVTLAFRLGAQKTTETLPIQQIATKIDDAVFSNRQAGLQSLTRADEILRVATGLEKPDNPNVTMVLETAKRIFDADLVYVLDKAGKVVSCTRYEGVKTLTGNNYAFRPYFQSAIKGKDTVYPALGVTTGQRGMYFSTPISGPDHAILGVVVVKVGVESIDAIIGSHTTPVFLVSPEGIIFASNRKEMLYHYVKPISAEALESIQASQQFADVALKPSTMLLDGKDTAHYRDETFHVSRRRILSDWSIIALVRGGPDYVINKNLVFMMIGIFIVLIGIIAALAYVIHARKQAEQALRESENSLRQVNGVQSLILDNSTVGIASVRHRAFEWVNARMGEILGMTQEEMRGASTRIIYASEEECERIGREAYPALASGVRFESEIQSARKDGTLFWARIVGKALDQEHPQEGTIWVFEDITERKRSEEELEAHREHLEELVECRTAELRDSKEQAEAATKAKSVFLASMSHELRTPLNAILGYAQLLTRTAKDPESRDNLQRVHRAGEHLLGLINHVLSLAKIEAGKLTLDLQPFSTDPFFKAIEEMTRVRAQAKGLDFRLEVRKPFPATLVGDPLKLRQILVNLLGNAIKFTPQGGVALTVDRTGDKVRFAVQDSGTGMTPEEVSSLFQAFHQTSSGQQATEGTGLGLHISQAMVRLMGGTIEVESQVGQGSLFRFEIPMPEAETPGEKPALPLFELAPGQPALRMLVVDDVEDNRTLLARMLATLGMEVREAEDGMAALEQWEAWQPHGVWMDLRMPCMDGFEAIKRLRARELELVWPHTVVVACTASVLDLELPPLQAMGFDDLLAKPFLEADLLDKLHHHCGLAVQREVLMPSGVSDAELSAQIACQPRTWIQSFDRALALGDRKEAFSLLDALPDRVLAEALAIPLKEFRFDTLRTLIAAGRPHD